MEVCKFNHYLVQPKLRLIRRWVRAKRVGCVKESLKVRVGQKIESGIAYQEKWKVNGMQ